MPPWAMLSGAHAAVAAVTMALTLTFAQPSQAAPTVAADTAVPRAGQSLAQGIVGSPLSAVAGDGRTTVAYLQQSGDTWRLMATASNAAGSSWSTPEQVAVADYLLDVSASVNGGVAIAYITQGTPYVATRPSGAQGWRVTAVATAGGAVSVAMLDDGSAVAGWLSAAESGPEAWVSVVPAAGDAPAPVRLATGVGGLHVAGDGLSTAVAVYDVNGASTARSLTASTAWSAGTPVCQCTTVRLTYGGAGTYLIHGPGGSVSTYAPITGATRTFALDAAATVAMGGGRLFVAWSVNADRDGSVRLAEVDRESGALSTARVIARYNLDPGFPDAPWVRNYVGSVSVMVDGGGVPHVAWTHTRWTKVDTFEPKSGRGLDRNEYLQAELYLSSDGGAPRQLASEDSVMAQDMSGGAGGRGVILWFEALADGQAIRAETFGSSDEASCLLVPSDGGSMDSAAQVAARAKAPGTRRSLEMGSLEAYGCFELVRPGVYVHSGDRVRINGIDIGAKAGTIEFRSNSWEVVFAKGEFPLSLEGVTFWWVNGPTTWKATKGSFPLALAIPKAGDRLGTPTKLLSLPLRYEAGVQLTMGTDGSVGGGYTRLAAIVEIPLPANLQLFGKKPAGKSSAGTPTARLVDVAENAVVGSTPRAAERGLPKPSRGRPCSAEEQAKGPIKKGSVTLTCRPNPQGVYLWVETPMTAKAGTSCSWAFAGQTFVFNGTPLQCVATGATAYQWRPPAPPPTAAEGKACSAAQEGELVYTRTADGKKSTPFRCVKGTWANASKTGYLTLAATATNLAGLARGEISLSELTVLPLTLQNIGLTYTRGTGTGAKRIPSEWSFQGTVSFTLTKKPAPGSKPPVDTPPSDDDKDKTKNYTISCSIKWLDGNWGGFSLGAEWPEGIPMGSSGVFLTKASGSLTLATPTTQASISMIAGIGVGPRFTWLGQDMRVVTAEGQITYSLGLGRRVFGADVLEEVPPSLRIAGNVQIAATPAASGWVDVQFTSGAWPPSISRIQYGGSASLGPGLSWFGWNGSLVTLKASGLYEIGKASNRWQIQGAADVAGVTGTALMSSRGWVICLPDGSGWSRTDNAASISDIATGCDVSLAALK